MNDFPEILAPVGGREQLKAAVFCGADAVYFGMQNFNARRNADNFSDDELAEVIKFCHLNDVKVNITLNTLVMDEEIRDMQEAVDRAAMAMADALIVQDLAVASYAKKTWPSMELHASTQMAAHNEEAVKILQDMGYDRIVLARELSLKEIEQIVSRTGANCEVFVHGAHCMSLSGNCYLSSMIGGRSGNRGLCAQPCRLDWKTEERNYALSLKDLSYISHIRQLQEAGVCSLKIEGRMKRAEYVAAAVTACRAALNGETPDLETLRAVFSRSGFSDGYLTGRRNADMFGYRTKEDVVAAKEVLNNLSRLYEKQPQTVLLDMQAVISKETPARLTVSDGKHVVTVQGNTAETALNRPLTRDKLKEQLSKTGGTLYAVNRFDCSLEENCMLPVSALNALRREALEKLSEERTKKPLREKENTAEEILPPRAPAGKARIRVRFEKAEQIFERLEAEYIILPVSEILKDETILKKWPGKVMGEIPAILWQGDGEKMEKQLEKLKKAGLQDVLCSNIGAMEIAGKAGLKIHGGQELNVVNSTAIEEYRKLGAEDLTVSFELSFDKVKKLGGTTPIGIISYGYLPLMKFRSCPMKTAEGCGNCSGKRILTDRRGEKFTVLCRGKKYSELLNCVPLYVADKHIPPLDFELLYFTLETKQECETIWELYKKRMTPEFARTAGLYFREIQ